MADFIIYQNEGSTITYITGQIYMFNEYTGKGKRFKAQRIITTDEKQTAKILFSLPDETGVPRSAELTILVPWHSIQSFGRLPDGLLPGGRLWPR